MSALLDAIAEDDLESVKRLIAEGADVKETIYQSTTPFVWAARCGRIPIIHWLLAEGGSSLTERTRHGASALVMAAYSCSIATMQYLLADQGASMSDTDNRGLTVWDFLSTSLHWVEDAAELSSLLKVMVLLEDAPVSFTGLLSPQHEDICTRGRQLRAQLPSYLEQQRAAVVAHCPLPGVLQSLVAAYAATTPEDMWADGLRVQTLRAKRGRTKADEGDDAPPLRRSLRLRNRAHDGN
jgi:hypothetical protein